MALVSSLLIIYLFEEFRLAACVDSNCLDGRIKKIAF